MQAWTSNCFRNCPSTRPAHWLAEHVIDPAFEAGDLDFALKVKLAEVGGPAAVWLIGQDEANEALGKARRLIDQRMKLAVLAIKALDTAQTSENALKIVAMQLQHFRSEQRLRHAERRLGEQCRDAERKHQIAMGREQRRREQARLHYQERKRKSDTKQAVQEARQMMEAYCRQLFEEAERAERLAIQERASNSPLAGLAWPVAGEPAEQAQPAAAPSTLPTSATPAARFYLSPSRLQPMLPGKNSDREGVILDVE